MIADAVNDCQVFIAVGYGTEESLFTQREFDMAEVCDQAKLQTQCILTLYLCITPTSYIWKLKKKMPPRFTNSGVYDSIIIIIIIIERFYARVQLSGLRR